MRNIFLICLRFYQKVLSRLKPISCRYYPTCSEYAICQFKYNNIFLAFFYTFVRILKCNQLFKGGIDYPIIYKKNKFSLNIEKTKIKFWFVPCGENKFYVIKVL